jgi:hypothetical protein
MAVGEKRSTWVISQVSWTDWTAQDVYYWQEHSFQYSANINCDDEMHGIKLSQKAEFASHNANCQLISCGGNGVIALRTDQYAQPYIFNQNNFSTWGTPAWESVRPNDRIDVTPWVVFQDRVWYGITLDWTNGALCAISNTGTWNIDKYKPQDHSDYTDEAISTPTPQWQLYMSWNVSAILNYNNTRLVVACSAWENQPTSIWVYYPELDTKDTYYGVYWQTGWKKVLQYEAWVTVVALTCTFEYLKVWAVDEWWNTKVYYYQGNNNLRSTFVYNVVDLTGVRVTRVYSINWIDYYVSSQDWTDGFVNLYKMVWNTPVSLFHQRWWLDPLDVNFKAPYFVWPCGIDAGYTDWTFYIADTYGLFRFRYTPQWYDKGYMKRKFNTNQEHPYWVCFNQWYLYVSTDKGCYKMRAYDTWVDGFQSEWVLISREYEGKEWGTITKMLDEIRLNYELNPLTNNKWSIDIYVSPNNLWKNTHTFTEANNWYHVMHIDNTNWATRTEKSNLFNDLGTWDNSSFKFDWQTITYAIVINQNTSTHATPIVRQIDIRYHTKDKVNNVYDIN